MTSKTANDVNVFAVIEQSRQAARQTYDNVWRVFFQHYMNTETFLSPTLLSEMFPWYGDARALKERFKVAMARHKPGANTMHLADRSANFLALVYEITPLAAARLANAISPTREFYETGALLTTEQALSMKMIEGSFTVLQGASMRVGLGSYAPDDIVAMTEENFVTLFAYLGDYLRETEAVTA